MQSTNSILPKSRRVSWRPLCGLCESKRKRLRLAVKAHTAAQGYEIALIVWGTCYRHILRLVRKWLAKGAAVDRKLAFNRRGEVRYVTRFCLRSRAISLLESFDLPMCWSDGTHIRLCSFTRSHRPPKALETKSHPVKTAAITIT